MNKYHVRLYTVEAVANSELPGDTQEVTQSEFILAGRVDRAVKARARGIAEGYGKDAGFRDVRATVTELDAYLKKLEEDGPAVEKTYGRG